MGSDSKKKDEKQSRLSLSAPTRNLKQYKSIFDQRYRSKSRGTGFRVSKPKCLDTNRRLQRESDTVKASTWVNSLIERGRHILSEIHNDDMKFEAELRDLERTTRIEESIVNDILEKHTEIAVPYEKADLIAAGSADENNQLILPNSGTRLENSESTEQEESNSEDNSESDASLVILSSSEENSISEMRAEDEDISSSEEYETIKRSIAEEALLNMANYENTGEEYPQGSPEHHFADTDFGKIFTDISHDVHGEMEMAHDFQEPSKNQTSGSMFDLVPLSHDQRSEMKEQEQEQGEEEEEDEDEMSAVLSDTSIQREELLEESENENPSEEAFESNSEDEQLEEIPDDIRYPSNESAAHLLYDENHENHGAHNFDTAFSRPELSSIAHILGNIEEERKNVSQGHTQTNEAENYIGSDTENTSHIRDENLKEIESSSEPDTSEQYYTGITETHILDHNSSDDINQEEKQERNSDEDFVHNRAFTKLEFNEGLNSDYDEELDQGTKHNISAPVSSKGIDVVIHEISSSEEDISENDGEAFENSSNDSLSDEKEGSFVENDINANKKQGYENEHLQVHHDQIDVQNKEYSAENPIAITSDIEGDIQDHMNGPRNFFGKDVEGIHTDEEGQEQRFFKAAPSHVINNMRSDKVLSNNDTYNSIETDIHSNQNVSPLKDVDHNTTFDKRETVLSPQSSPTPGYLNSEGNSFYYSTLENLEPSNDVVTEQVKSAYEVIISGSTYSSTSFDDNADVLPSPLEYISPYVNHAAFTSEEVGEKEKEYLRETLIKLGLVPQNSKNPEEGSEVSDTSFYTVGQAENSSEAHKESEDENRGQATPKHMEASSVHLPNSEAEDEDAVFSTPRTGDRVVDQNEQIAFAEERSGQQSEQEYIYEFPRESNSENKEIDKFESTVLSDVSYITATAEPVNGVENNEAEDSFYESLQEGTEDFPIVKEEGAHENIPATSDKDIDIYENVELTVLGETSQDHSTPDFANSNIISVDGLAMENLSIRPEYEDAVSDTNAIVLPKEQSHSHGVPETQIVPFAKKNYSTDGEVLEDVDVVSIKTDEKGQTHLTTSDISEVAQDELINTTGLYENVDSLLEPELSDDANERIEVSSTSSDKKQLKSQNALHEQPRHDPIRSKLLTMPTYMVGKLVHGVKNVADVANEFVRRIDAIGDLHDELLEEQPIEEGASNGGELAGQQLPQTSTVKDPSSLLDVSASIAEETNLKYDYSKKNTPSVLRMNDLDEGYKEKVVASVQALEVLADELRDTNKSIPVANSEQDDTSEFEESLNKRTTRILNDERPELSMHIDDMEIDDEQPDNVAKTEFEFDLTEKVARNVTNPEKSKTKTITSVRVNGTDNEDHIGHTDNNILDGMERIKRELILDENESSSEVPEQTGSSLLKESSPEASLHTIKNPEEQTKKDGRASTSKAVDRQRVSKADSNSENTDAKATTTVPTSERSKKRRVPRRRKRPLTGASATQGPTKRLRKRSLRKPRPPKHK
ncbi:hypothetical protein KAFR_0B03285 [Kazachstania africana CBS 2517]|uniref:Uncharacterized protein n=1 Tax=Kazachstania africana (strain ATCC 22294 / BCRC 22015 / CBS 2517 / CECT 1963 / NBRC 1671 / NRRL Y-8276) TaxID=1071382 RepID=H2AQH5_KAZAF|nr:hypothetical protein KAFR_0B03285 [Kazachstania africana CBS 2517]CCF56625.1 hypothetical protein KAFR_0B03285 [Kazachstania africana CBS 2517]